MKPLLALVALLGLAACGQQSEPPAPTRLPELPATSVSALDTEALWLSAADYWQAATEATGELNSAIDQLLEKPTAETLATARQRWQRAHQAISASAPLAHLSQGHTGLFAALANRWFAIDAYPVAPGYIDAIEGYPHSGVVNDTTLTINHTSLREQHGLSSEYEAILGLHVLEFLLWGEKGERDPRDFVSAEASATTRSVDQPQNRRRDLIKLVGILLQDDLQQLTEQWRDRHSRLAAGYFSLPPASRTLLWRQALASSLEDPGNHCDFRPEPCEQLPPIVDTLADLSQDYPALVIAERWPQQLEALQQSLAEEHSLTEGDNDALTQQLAALRETLSPL